MPDIAWADLPGAKLHGLCIQVRRVRPGPPKHVRAAKRRPLDVLTSEIELRLVPKVNEVIYRESVEQGIARLDQRIVARLTRKRYIRGRNESS
jgi:hypothetical protein